MEAIEFLRKKYSVSGKNTLYQEIGEPALGNWTLVCNLLDEFLQANRHEVLVSQAASQAVPSRTNNFLLLQR